MKGILALLCVCICIGAYTSAYCESMEFDGFSVRLLLPEKWTCVNNRNLSQKADLIDIDFKELGLLLDAENEVILIPPYNESTLPNVQYKLSMVPMESYHQAYSAMSEDQLANVGKSFLRSGNYDDYEIVETKTGLPVIKLRCSAKEASNVAYVSNQQGMRITILCYGESEPLEHTDAIYSIIDNITVHGKENYWDTFMEYRAFLTIPLGILIVILLTKRNASKNNRRSA